MVGFSFSLWSDMIWMDFLWFSGVACSSVFGCWFDGYSFSSFLPSIIVRKGVIKHWHQNDINQPELIPSTGQITIFHQVKQLKSTSCCVRCLCRLSLDNQLVHCQDTSRHMRRYGHTHNTWNKVESWLIQSMYGMFISIRVIWPR